MKKIIAFTIADNNNKQYADIMVKMFKYFNPDIEIRVYGEEEIRKTEDSEIFYRATPYFARKLFDEGYEIILKLDADNFIFGDLNHIFNDQDKYDIGVVYNWNRTDPQVYGLVGVWDIVPQEYFNCGFVVIKSKKLADHWWKLCNESNFKNYKFREQDLMNIICYYGDYEVKRLDDDEYCHGLISKGEGFKFIIKDKKVILPKAEDGYPKEDRIIKAYHVAGGNSFNKMNYRIIFDEPVIKLIDNILK
jgi:hypothetical protein